MDQAEKLKSHNNRVLNSIFLQSEINENRENRRKVNYTIN